ncbi:MAG: hypothetical protein C0594_13765 [Marinilabiliales bacterium]|nr:MAG: hypothetical protein C0594_13765 [Marinilabiliales bacterium]
MRDNFDNINEMFGEGFDDFRVDPSPGVWDSIEKKLNKKDLSELNKETFRDYKVNPSEGLWNTIARKLWLHNFFRFTANQLNVYYLVGVLVVVAGSVWLLNNEEKESHKDLLLTETQISTEANIVDVAALPSKTEESFTRESKASASVADNKTISESESQIVDIEQPVSEQAESKSVEFVNQDDKSANVFARIPRVEEKQQKPVGQLAMDNSSEIVMNEKVQGVVNVEITPVDVDTGLTRQSAILDENAVEDGNRTVLAEEHTVPETSEPLANTQNIEKENVAIQYAEPVFTVLDIAEAEKDLVMEEVEISAGDMAMVPDTVGQNAKGEDLLRETMQWSLTMYNVSSITQSSVEAMKPEYNLYADMQAEDEDYAIQPFGAFGVQINLNHKNFLFKGGIQYSRFGERYRYRVDEVLASEHYEYSEGGYFQNDTVWIVNIDSLIEGSDYQQPYVQQNWVETLDSNLVTSMDTLNIGNGSQQNVYNYIEIPLSVGYEYKMQRLTYSLNGGLTAGWLISTNGLTRSFDNFDENASLSDMKNYNNLRLYATAGLSATYYLNDRIGLFGEATYRMPLNSVYNQNASILKKNKSYMLKLGVRISLDKARQWDMFFKSLN